MEKFTFPVKSFKKLEEPFEGLKRPKYRFYVEVKDVPSELMNWMDTNPREQRLTTEVAKQIKNSLNEDNCSFHLWNRGILLSAEDITYDNKTQEATMIFTNPNCHGNIDGGHTLRIIIENNGYIAENPNLYCRQYVEFEVITGIDSTVLLAEARNTSTPVDTMSIEELNKTFESLKEILKGQEIEGDYYFNRISFKQNEHHNEEEIKKNIIDGREIIAILNMFNPTLYKAGGTHPITSYTGKEASLKRFLDMGLGKDVSDERKRQRREEEIEKMKPIIPTILEIWDLVERTLPDMAKRNRKKYGSKNYSNYGECSNLSTFSNKKLDYVVPKGLLYPLVGAFRALVEFDEKNNQYIWGADPFAAWEDLGPRLVEAILQASSENKDNPQSVGKSTSTWDLLYKDLYIYNLQNQKVSKTV